MPLSGPAYYALRIFTNELPELFHDHSEQPEVHAHQEGQEWPAYHLGDDDAGSICCYADDTTLTCTESRPAALSNKLTAQYKIIAEYMRNNRLKLNDEKTHLLVMDTGQSRGRAQAAKQVEIRTPAGTIRPSGREKLLGCWIDENLKWSEHLRDNKENLVRSLATRL